VIVVDTNLTTIIRATKVNLDLCGKVGLRVASRDGNPVIVTNELVPVTLTSNLLARGIADIAISGQTIVIVRKATDTNGSLALSVDHRSLLKHIEHKDTSAAAEASDEDPVVLTRVGSPLDLRRTAARWVIIIDYHAVLTMSSRLIRAVIVELKNSIVASVAVASSSNELGASTDDRNPDTLHSLVIARAEGLSREHGVVLNTPWELTTVDEVSLLTAAVLGGILLVEINVEVSSRIVGILSSDVDVVSLAVLSDESGIGAAILRTGLNNATHLIAITINLETSIELIELVASRSSDGLRLTIMSVTPPATTTLDPGTIARLIAGIISSGIAKKNIGEGIDILSIPALRVLSLLIRHNSKREGNTLKSRSSRGNSDVVRIRGCKEDDLSTKTAVIIIGSNTVHTRTIVSSGLIKLTLRVNIDDRIVHSGRASASCDNELTVGTLDTEEHRVLKINITALREGSVQVISLATVVVRDGSDNNGLVAEAVWVHCTLLDGQSETTTGIIETSNEHPVLAVHHRAPMDKRSTIASIVVSSDTVTSTLLLRAVAKDGDDGIVVGILVASVGNERSASTVNLVPETSSEPASATIHNIQASAGLTLNGVGSVIDIESVEATIVGGGLNLRSGEVEDTSRVEETSHINVIGHTLLSGEHNTTLPLIATIIVHSDTLIDVTALLVARREDEDDRIHTGTLIASIKNNSPACTSQGVPDTLRRILISIALDRRGVEGGGITLIQFIQFKCDTTFA